MVGLAPECWSGAKPCRNRGALSCSQDDHNTAGARRCLRLRCNPVAQSPVNHSGVRDPEMANSSRGPHLEPPGKPLLTPSAARPVSRAALPSNGSDRARHRLCGLRPRWALRASMPNSSVRDDGLSDHRRCCYRGDNRVDKESAHLSVRPGFASACSPPVCATTRHAFFRIAR